MSGTRRAPLERGVCRLEPKRPKRGTSVSGTGLSLIGSRYICMRTYAIWGYIQVVIVHSIQIAV